MALIDAELARELRELIAALDRRVPQVERAGEAAIARAALALRQKAIDRLAELSEQPAAVAEHIEDAATLPLPRPVPSR